jgi:hypothetical protein
MFNVPANAVVYFYLFAPHRSVLFTIAPGDFVATVVLVSAVFPVDVILFGLAPSPPVRRYYVSLPNPCP